MAVQNGSKVAFDYTLMVDGEIVDSSQGKEPLRYVHGNKEIIPGLSRGLEGMRVGEEKTIVVSPDEAYGEINPSAFREVPKSSIPKEVELGVGNILSMKTADGNIFPVRVAEIKEDTVVIDLNHPLAGKELNFTVKIREIQ
ncbi:MAG: hypothetical protein A2Z72_04450 [Omnitrophica bacterium RBG_13_46_9]|nr:MAG: hypothetical protein A2Z72_04450 [Omnitrophica bacterium RBG_13_46_9]